MRSLFVLLLLSLSSASYRDVSWLTVDQYGWKNLGNESTFFIPKEIKDELFNKIVLGNVSRSQIHYLNEHLGNTIYAMILDRLGKYATLPDYYRNALDNGVLCEVTPRLYEGTIKAIQYHVDTLTEEQRQAEIEAAKEIGINCTCTKTAADQWFCSGHLLLFTAANDFLRRISKTGLERKMCEHELIDSLHTTPKTSAAWFMDSSLSDNANRDFVILFNDTRGDLGYNDHFARRYCEALDPETEKAVKTIFAANALRWTLEGYVIEAVFNRKHKDIDSACSSENFRASEVGKCACKKDTGISFCTYKVRARYLQIIGYLNCDKMRFDSSKRPSSVLPFACHFDTEMAETAPECE